MDCDGSGIGAQAEMLAITRKASTKRGKSMGTLSGSDLR
jgi:hypothetical protein